MRPDEERLPDDLDDLDDDDPGETRPLGLVGPDTDSPDDLEVVDDPDTDDPSKKTETPMKDGVLQPLEVGD